MSPLRLTCRLISDAVDLRRLLLRKFKLKFLRFRPPLLQGETFPHIRLDRALEFLIGDRFP